MSQEVLQDVSPLFHHTELSVHKFGGTSMGSITAMHNSAKIILQIKGPVVVVVSAAAGVTRALMHLSHPSTSQEEQKELLDQLIHRQHEFLASLKHPEIIQKKVEALLAEIPLLITNLHKNRELEKVDALLSIGERLSSLLFSQVLAELGLAVGWFDVREVMKTDHHFGEAEPLLAELRKRATISLLPLCQQKILVTQGYIGQTLDGATTTLGKESSDYSAALLAEALGAHYFAIWSDMPGIFTIDPKITKTARPIKTMSIANALALTDAGAKVLHPRTMLPALRANMSFFVGSSQGLVGGTWVAQKADQEQPQICAVNLRQEQILLSFHHEISKAEPMLTKILQCLAKADIRPAYVYSDHFCTEILLDDSLREFRCESLLSSTLLADLQAVCPVMIETGLQLIAIIGDRLDKQPHLREVLADFIKKDSIRVLSFGMSLHTLFILVHENFEQAKVLIKQLHHQLFEF